MSKEMIVSSTSHETKIAVLEDDMLAELYFEREKEYTLAGSIYKGRVTRVLPGMQSAFVNIGLERDAFLYVSDFFEDAEEYDKIASTVEEKIIRMEENKAVAASPVSGAVPAMGEEAAVLEPGSSSEPVAEPVEAEAARPESGPGVAETAPVAPRSFNRGSERGPQQGGQHGPREGEGHGRYGRRGRRRRGGQHRGFPDSKYAIRPSSSSPPPVAPVQPAAPETAAASAAEPEVSVVEECIILPGESLAKYRGIPVSEGSSALPSAVPVAEEAPREAAQAPQPMPAVEQVPAQSMSEVEAAPPAPVSREAEPVEQPVASAPRIAERSQPAAKDYWEPEKAAAPAAETEPVSVLESTQSVPESVTAAPTSAEQLPATVTMAPETTEESRRSSADASADAEASAEEPPMLPEEIAETDDDLIEPGEFETAANGEAADSVGALLESNETQPGAPSAEAGSATAASTLPQRASVRERGRNPRYMRKGRWQGRREGRPEGPGRSPDSGLRPALGGGRPRERQAAPQPLIADLLKEGQEIIVQIAKEPLGKKGARITSHIALPGRYLVYMPTVNHAGVSRKISSDEERQRLKRIILEHGKNIPGGFIVRTAGEGHSEEDIRQDIEYLSKLWAETKAQAERASAPALLHHDLGLVLRVLRDQLSEEFSAVWVDNEQEYEKILGLVSKYHPALVNRVKLYTKEVPLFDEMGIQEEINKALKPKVWLKSGGYIVINQTEALVAIDVNTGKFVGKSNRLEDTIVKTNVEAIREIVRQIRLRDLGGIIVIDFIDMDEKKNRQKVMAAMEDALRNDRSPSKILAFNEFGLVAITRKRVRQSLERSLCQPCAYCAGAGLVKSVPTVCLEILSEARKIVPELGRKQITLRVNPEVGRSLKSRENTILGEIEEMTGKPVIIRNDPMLHIEHFDFN